MDAAGKLSNGRGVDIARRTKGAAVLLAACAVFAMSVPEPLSAQSTLLWRRPAIQPVDHGHGSSDANRAAHTSPARQPSRPAELIPPATAIRLAESDTAAPSGHRATSSIAFAGPLRDPNIRPAQFTRIEAQSASPADSNALVPDPIEGDFGFEEPPLFELAQNPNASDRGGIPAQTLEEALRQPLFPADEPADRTPDVDPFADDPAMTEDPAFPRREPSDDPFGPVPELDQELADAADTPQGSPRAQVSPDLSAQPPGSQSPRVTLPPAPQSQPQFPLQPVDPFQGMGELTREQREQEFRDLCREELAELKASTLADVTLDIRVRGVPDVDFPLECSIDDGSVFVPRSWAPLTYLWKASALCHRPLYFEDAQLERYGHSWGPVVQPFVSGAHFFSRFPVLPYCMGYTPPTECIYALGYYRPGSCAPYMIPAVPISARAALIQAGAATGTAIVIP